MTQKDKILLLLKDAGARGLNSYDITYKYRIKQGPTRIFELKKDGYFITKRDHRNGLTTYYLIPGHVHEKNTPQPNVAPKRPRYEFDKDGNAREILDDPEPQQGALW
jgi:hypothetical protein